MRRMPARIRSASIGLAILAATGCGSADPTDSDRRQTLTAEETLRIGSVDDPETALTDFRDLERSPDGRIYTLHFQGGEIRVHAPDGTPLGSFGGESDGPGEFQSPSSLGILGDELWVLDPAASRTSFFTLDGTFLRDETFRLDPSQVEDGRMVFGPRPSTRLPDGRLIASVPVAGPDLVSGVTETPLLLLSSAGSVLDTLLMRPLSRWVALDNGTGGGSAGPSPFDDSPLFLYSPEWEGSVYIDRTVVEDVHTFRVTKRVFSGDTVFDRRFAFEPVEMTASIADSIIGARAEQLSSGGFFTRERAASEIRAKVPVPPHLAAVRSGRPGRDGTIWLELEGPEADATTWLVLAPEGDPIGEVRLPTSFSPHLLTREEAWGLERDELDVPYIVSYSIRPAKEEE